MPRPAKNPKATLTFVLVGIGIAVLVAVPFFKIVKAKADETIARRNLRILGGALQDYTQDYDGKLPPLQDDTSFRNAMESYVPNMKDHSDPFVDPAANAPFVLNSKLSFKEVSKLEDSTTSTVATQNKPMERHVLTLFADGHVENVPADR